MKTIAAALLLALFASPALAQGADTALTCKFVASVKEVNASTELPRPIRDDLGRIAERGQPMDRREGTVLNGTLPTQQFLRGGTYNGVWFVWIETGGYSFRVLRFYKNGPDTEPVRTTPAWGDICNQTVAIMNARPSSPNDAAWANDRSCILSHKVEEISSPEKLPTGLLNAMGGSLGTSFVRAGRIQGQWFIWQRFTKTQTRVWLYEDPKPGGLSRWPEYRYRAAATNPADMCLATDQLLDANPPRPN